MTMTQLFGTMESRPKTFGEAGPNGRYHMPLLPGESGPKSIKNADWVSGGVMRMTNLVGAFEDTRALNIWEQGMALIGLALDHELYEQLVLIVQQAAGEGVVFEKLREYAALKEALAGHPHDKAKQDKSIVGRAKLVAKAGAAAQRGTNRHTAWEHRANTGQLIGTPEIIEATLSTEKVLADAGYVRIPGLSERVVRNLAINAVGKFDDIVMRLSDGALLIADLKTKARPFYSWTTVEGQLAGYARSEWMLTEDRQGYEPGPLHHVDQKEGLILHVPSDGTPAHLDTADLENGWEVALTARKVVDLRAGGKTVSRHALGNCSKPVVDVEKNLEEVS